MWTSRLRREWGLFFDRHDAKKKGLGEDEKHERKEKDRGDHRHHAIDAVVIALCTQQVRNAWEARERAAEQVLPNSADEEAMDNYRRQNPLDPPKPYKSREEFRQAVRRAVFGVGDLDKPICHRPVKRKLIGALHKATQYGSVVEQWLRDGTVHREVVPDRVTVRQDILGQEPTNFLKPAHLRMPRPETDDEAIQRLARRLRIGKAGLSEEEAAKAARKLVRSKAFTRMNVDPKPEKGGIVRDIGTRRLLRKRLKERGLNPDADTKADLKRKGGGEVAATDHPHAYTKADLKRSIDQHGPLRHDSGVPIYGVVLLWSNSDPVSIQRDHFDYTTGERSKLSDPGSLRLYDSQNNLHIEIRIGGKAKWSGEIVTAFEAAQRKRARLRAFRDAGVPEPDALRALPKAGRAKWAPVIRAAEKANPLVDRRDDDAKGGAFVMSLCEGEMLLMKHKETGEVGYFVVAKLDKPQAIVVVPHWDARAAGERKDSAGKPVPDSKRDQFSITPTDLRDLAPPGHLHAAKVRVSPLGDVTILERD
jgi:CRISPR-associated endonuclease Csn1